ncbi:MAG: phosphoenolpyruvate carboxylase, partial [Pseudomonadota bacterium]
MKRIESLDDNQLRILTKAFGNYFQLINIAEDQQRIRVLRDRELKDDKSESIDDALATLKAQGIDAAAVRDMLNKVEVRLVLTAHPSESKRQEVLIKLREIALMTRDYDRTTLLPREEHSLLDAMAERIEELWHTRPTRSTKATVSDEVQFGLYFLTDVIMDEVVDIHIELRQALDKHYPDADWSNLPQVVKFASWVGGDRDGNPNVTADVTLDTLETLRQAGRAAYLADVEQLRISLTQATDEIGASQAIIDAVEPLGGYERLRGSAASKFPGEVYRQQMELVHYRLTNNIYGRSEELLNDLRPVIDSLKNHRGHRAARGRVFRLMQKVRLFGLHIVPPEVREDAGR